MIYSPTYLPSNRLLLLPDILLSYIKIQLSSYVYNKGIPFVFCGHWVIVVVCNDSMFEFANYN